VSPDWNDAVTETVAACVPKTLLGRWSEAFVFSGNPVSFTVTLPASSTAEHRLFEKNSRARVSVSRLVVDNSAADVAVEIQLGWLFGPMVVAAGGQLEIPIGAGRSLVIDHDHPLMLRPKSGPAQDAHVVVVMFIDGPPGVREF